VNTADSPLAVSQFPPTAPLLTWCAFNVAALAIAAARFPFSARYPTIGEQLAPQVLVVTQVVVAALLFPFLVRSWTSTLAVAASVFPFLAVAAFLGAKPQAAVLPAAAFVAAWVATLGVWASVLKTPVFRGVATVVAALLAIGEPLLHYLGREFGRPPAVAVGPTLQALALAEGRWEKVGGIALVTALIASAVLLRVAKRSAR
jgi:hypothetical protein